MTSVAQMFCRSNNTHMQVLSAVAYGEKIQQVRREHLTCMRTLIKWGAVRNEVTNGIPTTTVTDVGLELLARFREAGWTHVWQGPVRK